MEKVLIPLPVHEFPSGDVAIVFPVPSPAATHNEPFHATPFPTELKMVVPRPVHVVPPSDDVAIVFVP